MTAIYTGENASPMLIKDRNSRAKLTWNVTWREGGDRKEKQTNDRGLVHLCAFLSDRADNATLIVTPLP